MLFLALSIYFCLCCCWERGNLLFCVCVSSLLFSSSESLLRLWSLQLHCCVSMDNFSIHVGEHLCAHFTLNSLFVSIKSSVIPKFHLLCGLCPLLQALLHLTCAFSFLSLLLEIFHFFIFQGCTLGNFFSSVFQFNNLSSCSSTLLTDEFLRFCA